jgi:hypothetical protein
MVYVNINGTREGAEQCRRQNVRAQAAADQCEALFRDFCEQLAPEARADFADFSQCSLKVQRWLGRLAQAGAALPTAKRMLSIIEAIDTPGRA